MDLPLRPPRGNVGKVPRGSVTLPAAPDPVQVIPWSTLKCPLMAKATIRMQTCGGTAARRNRLASWCSQSVARINDYW